MIQNRKVESTLDFEGDPSFGDLEELYGVLYARHPDATVTYIHYSGGEGNVRYEYFID